MVNTFNEQLTYDKNGNIQTLVRNGGMESQTTVPVIDNLVYGYDANEKNKLIKVTDATANTDGFKDGANNTIEYGYDQNGNMTRDDNKMISSIVYNHLNLPTKIIFNADSNTKIEYLYTAVGQKIQKNVFKYHRQITATLIPAPAVPTDYLGGFQYVFEGLQFFPTAEGYVKYTEGASNPFDYVFNYTDHLGNIRLSYGINPGTGLLTKMEENNYYPFGLKHATYNSTARVIVVKPLEIDNTLLTGKTMVQKVRLIDIITPIDPPTGSTTVASSEYNYKYNGKEYQDELGLNMYDYGWRNYMPDIGRWTQIDPLFNDLKFAHNNSQVDDEDDQEEVYMSIINDLELGGGIYNTDNLNPYGYGYNNPVSFDDPDGRCPACWGALMGAIVEYGGQVAANLYEGKSLSQSMTDIDVSDVLVSAGEGALTGGASAVKSLIKKTAITVGSEIIKNAVDVNVKDGKVNGKVNDVKTTARNTVIGLAINGAGKAIPSTKVKVKSEITPKQAVKTARAAGPVTTAQRKEIQNQAKKTLKENKAINKTANGASGSTASGTTAEVVKQKEDKANGN